MTFGDPGEAGGSRQELPEGYTWVESLHTENPPIGLRNLTPHPDMAPRAVPLPAEPNRTALVTDEAMARHMPFPKAVWDAAATEAAKGKSPPPGAITSYNVAYGVSERPCRLTESLEELASTGLAARCIRIPAARATREQLLRAHSPGHKSK